MVMLNKLIVKDRVSELIVKLEDPRGILRSILCPKYITNLQSSELHEHLYPILLQG